MEMLSGEAPGSNPRAAKRTPGKIARYRVEVEVDLSAVAGLKAAAADMGMPRNRWIAALVHRRLLGRPKFNPAEALSLLAIQAELRRIGANVIPIARALNAAALEGGVADVEPIDLDELRREMRSHVLALREAFEGNLAYWETPE